MPNPGSTAASPFRRPPLVAALVAAVLLVGTAPVAAADPRGYDVEELNAGRFYGDFDAEVLLITGAGAEAWCGGVEPTAPARVHDRQDGGTEIKMDVQQLPFVLYRTPLGAPEFIEATCEALFDGDPGTVTVQPFAHGTGRLKERVSESPDGVEEWRNGVNGFAVGTDGTRWKVRTWADFVVDNGVLVGDPAEFQGLDIHQVGP